MVLILLVLVKGGDHQRTERPGPHSDWPIIVLALW